MLSTEVGETGKMHEQYIYVFLPPMQFQRTLKKRKKQRSTKASLIKKIKKMCKIAFVFVRKNRVKNEKIAKK